MEPQALLQAMFEAAIVSAQPALRLPHFLPPPPPGRTVVVGAGKASAAMAQALEAAMDGADWPGPVGGVVVTRDGYAVPCRRIEILEASHPEPDERSQRAALRLMKAVAGLTPDDLVIALMSGGGSALLCAPPPGVTLADKRALNLALLHSGASIRDINRVRRHVSLVKGGRLAATAHPARLVTLLISDVPGDDPIDVASGPTVADPTTAAEALAVLRRLRIEVPPHILRHLETGAAESVKPDDPRLAGAVTRLIAAPQIALEAAALVAREAGVTPVILGDSIEGEAREVGTVMAGIARQVALHGQPAGRPCILLSGGETGVTVRGAGRGGRNVEFLLALGIALDGLHDVWALAGDTDGVDGREEIAGAWLGPDLMARAQALGLDPKVSLADNDGHGFFGRLGQSIVTGPTLTNVNDFRAILIL